MKLAKLTDLNIEYHIADIEGVKVWSACDMGKGDYGVAYINSDNTSGVDFDCPSDIPRAISMCIIKNKLREQAK